MDAAPLKTLDELAIEHQTDRASVFSRTWGKPHGYASHYDKLFTPLREKSEPMKLLEIGSASGEGIRMWLDYFPKGQIYGVDTVSNTCEWNVPGRKERFTFIKGDQSCSTFWACFLVDYGRDFDIVIDDGSHFNCDIISTFNHLWPMLNPGGFYAIEDLGVAYGGDPYFQKPNFPNHMQWLLNRIDLMNTSGMDIDSIYFSRELAVLRKAL